MSVTRTKPESLVSRVSKELSDLIRHQPPESNLLPPERKLAEQFGVSRPVVREAIKRLELQGLLEVRQGSGNRIVNKLHRPLNESLSLLIPDEDERQRQLLETRMALEPESARMAALRSTPEQQQVLRKIHAALEAATVEEAIELDMAFHRAVAEAGGNRMFGLVLDSLADLGRASRVRTIGRVGQGPAIEHHQAIIEAIVAGDAEGAAEAMRYHLGEAEKDMNL